MGISDLGKFKWEKGEEWFETWYSTEICLRTFAENPLVERFTQHGLNALVLNTQWFYEERSSRLWKQDRLKVLRRTDILERVVKEMVVCVEDIKDVIKRVKSAEVIDQQLFNEIKNGWFACWYIYNVHLDGYVDEVLKEKFRVKKIGPTITQRINDYLLIFDQLFDFQREQENFKKIKSLYTKKYGRRKTSFEDLDPEIKRLLESHCTKFRYLTHLEIDTEPWTMGDYFKKLAQPIVNQGFTKEKRLSLKVIEKLTSEDIEFLELVKQYSFLDNWTPDLNAKLDFTLQIFLSRKFNVSLRDLTWYSFAELENLFIAGVRLSKRQLEERKKFRVMVQIEGETAMFYGKENFERARRFVGGFGRAKKVKQFSGFAASPGKVSGTVKVIRGVKDMEKFKKGDILVANTTHPDLMLAIMRAAAIVTDYGGITSHAAIISREFRIPCIVGTEVATDVLRDGNLVEVNADKGIVKIIK